MSILEFKTLAINSKYRPHSRNPILKMKTRKQCKYCKMKNNQSHIFKTLWALFVHVRIQHPNEDGNFILEYERELAKQARNEGKKA